MDRAVARHTDPWPSHAAAAKIDAQTCKKKVFEALKQLGGEATSKGMGKLLHWDRDSVSPRVTQLQDDGLVKPMRDSDGAVVMRDGETVWTLGSEIRATPVSKAQLRKENKRFRDVFVYAVQYGLTPKEALEALEWVNGNDRR